MSYNHSSNKNHLWDVLPLRKTKPDILSMLEHDCWKLFVNCWSLVKAGKHEMATNHSILIIYFFYISLHFTSQKCCLILYTVCVVSKAVNSNISVWLFLSVHTHRGSAFLYMLARRGFRLETPAGSSSALNMEWGLMVSFWTTLPDQTCVKTSLTPSLTQAALDAMFPERYMSTWSPQWSVGSLP